MLAIRLQRTGRSGHAQFRVVVQDGRFSPKSGRIVAYVGSYDPHSKEAKLNGEQISRYLDNGAQPSGRVAELFKKEGIKLPAWVKASSPQKRSVRNPEKLRRNRPADAPAPAAAAEEPAETAAEASAEQPPAENPETLAVAEEVPAEAVEEAPVEPTEPAAEAEPEPEQPAAQEGPAETPPEEPAA